MTVLNDINWGKHKVYFRRCYFCPLTLTVLLNAFPLGPSVSNAQIAECLRSRPLYGRGIPPPLLLLRSPRYLVNFYGKFY